MNKNELIGAVADASGLSRSDATKAVEGVFDTITGALSKGDEVRLVGFGTFSVAKRKASEGRIPHVVKALQEDLKLPRLPRHIECFDVSHLGGTGVVASCIVFGDGKPRKRDYRTYKVRSVGDGRAPCCRRRG